MKKTRLLILFMFLFILTGCSGKWEDIQKEYGDLLAQNPRCEYKAQGTMYHKLEGITLSANNVGLHATIKGANNSKTTTLFGPNGSVSQVEYSCNDEYNVCYVVFTNSFLEQFMTSVRDNKTCPQNIYISNDVNHVSLAPSIDAESDILTLGGSKLPAVGGGVKECHHANATNCVKLHKQKEIFGQETYLEIGYYKNNEGTLLKYLGVGNLADYSDMVFDNNGSLSIHKTGSSYTIPKEVQYLFFKNDGSLIYDTKVGICVTEDSAGSYYFITHKDYKKKFGSKCDFVPIEGGPGNDPDPGGNNPGDSDTPSIYNFDKAVCKNEGVTRAMYIIGIVIQVIKILAPILIVVLGMIDFGKSVAASDEAAIKKSTTSLIRRFIAGIAIFFVPTILYVVVDIVEKDILNEENTSFGACTKCVLKPSECDRK